MFSLCQYSFHKVMVAKPWRDVLTELTLDPIISKEVSRQRSKRGVPCAGHGLQRGTEETGGTSGEVTHESVAAAFISWVNLFQIFCLCSFFTVVMFSGWYTF